MDEGGAIDAWLHPAITRKNAEARIISEGAPDGMFLVRPSASDSTTFILTVCHSGKIHHTKIIQRFQEDEPVFTVAGVAEEFFALGDVIQHLQHTDVFPGPLVQPCPTLSSSAGSMTDDIASELQMPSARSSAQQAPRSNPFADQSQLSGLPAAATLRSQRASTHSGIGTAQPKSPFEQPAQASAVSTASAQSGHGSSSSVSTTNPFAATITEMGGHAMDDTATIVESTASARRATLTGLVRDFTTNLLIQGRRSNPTGKEMLLCEGYLKKLRGALHTKRRWFMLTTHRLSYYESNAGKLIASVAMRFIESISDVPNSNRFYINTSTPFGASGQLKMALEADSRTAKLKWINAMLQESSDMVGFNSDNAELIIEGALVKVQASVDRNKTRWFRLTTKKLAYYRHEGGEEMASVPLAHVTKIVLGNNKPKEFVVMSNQPFTASGLSQVRCRCESADVRAKWATGLRQVIPTAEFTRADL
eukprot:m.362710 g.362710  ORF g.362710 m.362710 type:complete len:478 (+) comp20795_c0_seq1:104-1537(+)